MYAASGKVLFLGKTAFMRLGYCYSVFTSSNIYIVLCLSILSFLQT